VAAGLARVPVELVARNRCKVTRGGALEFGAPRAEQARRRALDAWTRIAEITAPCDPDQALAALETALGHDPYNEFVYQKIMQLQAAAGRPDAVRRTLGRLEARLGDLGITPGPQTRTLAASLLGAPLPQSPLLDRGTFSKSR
jgi:DNA-binding SARP family transcriptional activator